jgi:hypothetical protein
MSDKFFLDCGKSLIVANTMVLYEMVAGKQIFDSSHMIRTYKPIEETPLNTLPRVAKRDCSISGRMKSK